MAGQTGDRVVEIGPSSGRRQLQENRSEQLAQGGKGCPAQYGKTDSRRPG